MKRCISFLLSVVAAALTVTPCVAAGNGFSVVRNRDHKQPHPDPTYSYIEKYDCYYVDKKHGDTAEDKVLYLTFDAGYENGNVEKILDVLHEEQVPGAFFVLSHLVADNTGLVRRMREEGHLVCNHTARHRDMTKCTDKAAFEKELNALASLYKEKIGEEMPKYYRPPEGKLSEQNLQFLRDLGYKTIMWSFAYADWDNDRQPDPVAAKEKIMTYTHNGAIILLHPTSATNAAILKDCIKTWKEQGYRFGTLDEL